MIIASDKTLRVEESQHGDIFPHWASHSESDWTTEEVFGQYFQHISYYYHNEEIHLILNVYTADKTEVVKAIAQTLNINMYYIPPGCTYLLQPLDIRDSGALLRNRYQGVPSPRVTSKETVQNLIELGKRLISKLPEKSGLCMMRILNKSIFEALPSTNFMK